MTDKNDEVSILLKRIALQNDEKAFSVFFDRYHTRLLRFANVYVQSIREAEDIVSDVFVHMLKNKKEVFLKEHFIGYLFQSVKNKCIDHARRESKRANLFDLNYNERDYFIFDNQTPFNKIVFSELDEIVKVKIESLPPRRRMVFKMIKEDDLTYKEVASLMDISERTVEVHLKLAVQEIRQTLEKYLSLREIKNDDDMNGIISILMLVTLA